MTVDNNVETLFSVGYREPMTTALRDTLRAEALVLCLALLHARTPDVPAIAAACGYDAVYVDLEHTSTSLDTAQMLCASALGAGISGLVRVPSNDPSVIARVLDGGAVGVIVPHINSKKEAERVVQAARFPPIGNRSISGPNAVSGYAPRTAPQLVELLEGRTVVAVMIETPEAVEAADSIAAVDGVDMILIGPSDLTAEMGIHGQYENDHFHSAVESVAAACRSHGVALGIAGIKSVDLLNRFVGLGLRFISAGTDVGMMTEAASARAQALRGLQSHRDH
ncbi:aldolase [Mycobacterium intracellulare subsp. chimaera]|uniref:HpcH/HpaI aldolase family protein n=1 Tax=Mycobacterium intracellulare TaxID=1767 RepID=UPI0004AD95F3|nr:aldolase/citrate lyase family protein [Mycobacterium intracellulare]ARV81774.1 aldolase [Mycobacterium intracellulare subsp. chimaera]ASL08876.1 hpcH/HpaI aldolase [Mycobacterium intracellulare subsp. chimaera]ASL20658.1 hpcH/HpaI aldolase [Mycobacterium intracellulare subsp. chimaera]KPN52639.1 aldolase [Mycobacterium intracellulare subsp. chimaera]KPN57485.1 aldolase [Mycobacterium intracellulare subsp. chimaera]